MTDERRRVRRLSADVARKIAAGEVIDRPCAIVRELMDNSVDSGAGTISVEINDGGIGCIRICDDGSGMTPEDLRECAHPHATSKISEADDLLKLTTLGFRGEALSSIAAVSRLTISSGTSRLRCSITEDHIIDSIAPVQNGKGTIVTSEGLFENFPARRLFLKRPSSETLMCREVFTEKALPRPDIAFRLTTDGSLRLDLPKTESLKERFISALELKQPPELFSIISGEDPSSAKDWSFKLVIGEPSVYRNDRKQIFIYVNGRRVTEYSLVQAVEYGCQGFFPNGTHPVAALFVQMNPALVDFNIHPAKKEVRFKDSSALHHGVSSMTHSYFRASGIRSSSQSISSGNESYRPEREFDFSTPSVPSFNTSAVSPVQRMKNYDTSSFKSSFSSFPVMDSIPSDLASQALYSEAVYPSQEDFPAEETESAFTFIGTALGTFILIQVSDTLYFIDQHAAHERIIFDGLIKDGGEKQNLLIPYEIHTDSDEDDAYISSACSSLLHAGFTFEKAGKGIWNVTTVPLRWTGTQQELEDCLFDKRTESQDILYKIAAMTACKAAVKDGYELDRDEAEKIARKALKLPDPHCPHGRPVWTTISKAKLFEMVRRTR